MTTLDWGDRRHFGGGKTRPCRECGQPALLLDSAGRPAHKVCVESLLDDIDALNEQERGRLDEAAALLG